MTTRHWDWQGRRRLGVHTWWFTLFEWVAIGLGVLCNLYLWIKLFTKDNPFG